VEVGKKGGDKMIVTRIRAGVMRLELKPDEELEIHQLAVKDELTFEEQLHKIIEIGIAQYPISETDGR